MNPRSAIVLATMIGGLAACPRAPADSPRAPAARPAPDAGATAIDAAPPAPPADADSGIVIGPAVAEHVAYEDSPTCERPRALSRTARAVVGVRFCTAGGTGVSVTSGELVLSRDGRASWTWTSHTPRPPRSGEPSLRTTGTSTVSGCWREHGGGLELDAGGGWTRVRLERDAGQPLLRSDELAYHVCPR